MIDEVLPEKVATDDWSAEALHRYCRQNELEDVSIDDAYQVCETHKKCPIRGFVKRDNEKNEEQYVPVYQTVDLRLRQLLVDALSPHTIPLFARGQEPPQIDGLLDVTEIEDAFHQFQAFTEALSALITATLLLPTAVKQQ